MSFHFAPSSPSDSESDSDLPFPPPLPPHAFSSPAPFSPHQFLSTLTHRHQTLEDLRSELRQKSHDLETELLELVNRHYADFLSLGTSVRGGETKVEDLKVGLLGFKREVEGVRGKVEETRRAVETELRRLEAVRREKKVVRSLVEVGRRTEELAGWLMLPGAESAGAVEGDGEGLTGMRRLRRIVAGWVYLRGFAVRRCPDGHPFVKGLEGRMREVREALVSDLRQALREARREGDGERGLEVLEMLARVGAEGEAIKTLKETR